MNEYMVKNPDDRMRALMRKFVDKVEVDNSRIVVWFKLDHFLNSSVYIIHILKYQNC